MNNGIVVTLTGTSPALPGTVAGPVTDVAVSLAGYKSMRIEASLVGATGGSLDVYLQVSYDSGISWSDYVHFAQIAVSPAVATTGVSVSRSKGDALAAVGKNLTPSLTAATARDGEWGSMARLLFVANSGTTAGATQTVTLFLSN